MSLRVWLPLDGDLRNQGASSASVTNTGTITRTLGKIGPSQQFGAVGTGKSYLKFNNMDFIHDFTECSITLWIKILSWNTSYATYFQLGLGSTPWAHYIFGLLRNNDASTLCFTISNGSSATNANCLTPALDLDTWYHLTLIYADGHCKIYVNGIETNDYSTTIVPNFAGITTGIIGACNNGNNYQTYCLMNDFRIYDHCLSVAEIHEIAQGLVLHYKLDDITHGIEDSSGYNHNGEIFGDLITTADTKRYSYGTKWNCSDPTTNSSKGKCYIKAPLALSSPLQMSVSWWAKPENGYGGGTNDAAFCTSVKQRPTDYNSTAMHHRDAGFDLCPSSGSSIRLTFDQYTANQWHHYVITYDGQTARAYKDGTMLTSASMAATSTLKQFTDIWIGYSQAGGVQRKTLGTYSDFRVYCTALSVDDILALYHTGAKVDNKQNLHTFELIETNKQQITKQGQTKGQNLLETYLPLYDKTIYTEPDGSTWIHIFHHNNPANSKFNDTTTDWTTGKYLDADRWYDVDHAIYYTLGPYEFMLKQKTTSSATETKYRWIQAANPLTAVWADVKPGTVTFNTSSGYTNSSYGGMYLFKNTNLHMCIANGSNGNWYGGIGAAAAYNGGIPGFPNTTVTSGYIDLYLRVYVNTKMIKNIGISSLEFIEF